MCLETRIFPYGINWNHKYHAYCVFLSRIHICFWVLYILMRKLVAMATILEGDVLQANYLSWPHVAICGPRHVVFYFLTLVRTITADFLWIRTTGTGKKYIFFIFWSWGWFRYHGNQIRTRRWHTEVCAILFPIIYIHFLISSGDL